MKIMGPDAHSHVASMVIFLPCYSFSSGGRSCGVVSNHWAWLLFVIDGGFVARAGHPTVDPCCLVPFSFRLECSNGIHGPRTKSRPAHSSRHGRFRHPGPSTVPVL
jgi:hypothetical protein